VNTYNALIDKSGDYRAQSRWLQIMTQRGIRPNVDTFNAMLRSAKSEGETRRRLNRMMTEGISPDSATLDILVSKASDFASANDWIEQLAARSVSVSAAAYERLLELAEGFALGGKILEKMISEGHQPSDTAFISLFAKDLSEVRADDLLRWYLGLRYHPTHPIKRAIAEYRRKGLIDDALRLTLDYPHTDTSLKTIRQFPERALHYYRSIVATHPDHANGAYALGMALVETGRPTEAETWLRKAYQLAAPGTRKDELARYLSLLERVVVAAT
jgi:tetratricopeptide (TPR) repeat protein